MLNEIHSNLEIRLLPKPVISELGNILQLDHSWRDVMGLVPDEPWTPEQALPEGLDYNKKYSSDDICLVADECNRDGRTGFEVLVEEWGTSGRIRAKVANLIRLLYKSGLERAAVYLQSSIKDPSEEEVFSTLLITQPKTEPCLSGNNVDISLDFDSEVPLLLFEDVSKAVKDGIVIGEGAFGSVHKVSLSIGDEEKVVAIKILKDSEEAAQQHLTKEKVFKTEVEILSKCFHKNIIKLEGFSYSQCDLALVYLYMENGSLYERLACLGDSTPMSWRLRLDVARGIAEGIVYLHTVFSPPLVHRDIKSPNVLLDQQFIPKLGDFGIVRFGSRGMSGASTAVQTTPVGTQMYMAPEAFRGDVSVKMDTFSFAIIVLELLTGLPYFDENRENRDILSYVEEYEEEVVTLLDERGGDDWDQETARALFHFAELCTKEKKQRPDMVRALAMLNSILEKGS